MEVSKDTNRLCLFLLRPPSSPSFCSPTVGERSLRRRERNIDWVEKGQPYCLDTIIQDQLSQSLLSTRLVFLKTGTQGREAGVGTADTCF